MNYNKKNTLIKSLIIIFTIIFFTTGCSFNRKYKFSPRERLAWTRLRLAIAESVLYDGSTSLTREDIKMLKNVAKENNKNNEWFNDTDINYTAYGKTIDTDSCQITLLCSEDYCAKFKVLKGEDGNYYLEEYSFGANDVGGYILFPTD